MKIRLQTEDFDVAAEAAALLAGRTDIGAVVTFTGVCRGTEAGEPIAALTLEHYPQMAEAEITRHVVEAEDRWPLMGVTVIHRYGRIEPGQNIVLLVAAAAHRPAADGGVWYTDQHQGRLGKLDPNSGKIEQIALGPGSAPHGVVVASDGAAWVTDAGQNAMVRVDPQTRKVGVFPLPKEFPEANL